LPRCLKLVLLAAKNFFSLSNWARSIGQGNLGGGGDDVCLVHTAEGNTVDLKGSGDEEQATGQLLQAHNALATVGSRKENQNSSRGDRLAQSGGLGSVPASELDDSILSRVDGRLGGTSSLLGSLLCDDLLEATVLVVGPSLMPRALRPPVASRRSSQRRLPRRLLVPPSLPSTLLRMLSSSSLAGTLPRPPLCASRSPRELF